MGAWYTTLERVMRASDVKAVAYQTPELSAAIESASRAIDRLCHRGDQTRPGFAPWTGAITYDWPVDNNEDAYRFELNQNALSSLTAAVSGGVDIFSACLLRPETGPPYSCVIVDRDSDHLLTFTSGAGERSLVLTGTWAGAAVVERSPSAWLLGSSPNSTTDQITFNAPIGVGSIVRIGDERTIVTGKTWADSTQDGSLSASRDAQALAVSDGTAFFTGEELLIESERVLVRDIAGNNLIVQRAVAGSTLSAHTGASIFFARSFTVERGALGTTAAGHTSGAQLYVWQSPPLVEQLAVAYAQDQRAQESSAYGRTVGTGDAERQMSGGGDQGPGGPGAIRARPASPAPGGMTMPDTPAKLIVALLLLWLMLALAVAAGVILGAWAISQYVAGAMQGVADSWQ